MIGREAGFNDDLAPRSRPARRGRAMGLATRHFAGRARADFFALPAETLAEAIAERPAAAVGPTGGVKQ